MYDYIIVGGGSAGCVLADRLTKDRTNQVLLLEAGPKDWNPFIHMPAGVADMIKRPWANWQFNTAPEKEMAGRRMYWPRGKALGGSSSINGMIYIRGNRWDYDHWAELGNKGWSYADVLPYFKRSECYQGTPSAYHGASGPLKVSQLNESNTSNELFTAFIEAGKQAGYPTTGDFNGGQQEGVGWYQTTINEGRRQSSAVTFLKEAKGRSNLTITTNAQVTRVLMEDRKATGVEFVDKRSNKHQIKANKEVLLAAGVCQSPHLLMLSGIGAEDALNKHGIKLVHHLPGVGENLQDHLDVAIQHHCTQPITLYKQMKPLAQFRTAIKYALTKKGLGATQGLESGGFLRTDPSLDLPDVQYHFVSAFMLNHARELGPGHGFMLHGCQLRPESRGFIGLNSADPFDAPLIQPNYLTAQKDIDVQVRCIKQAREIFSQPAFDPYRGDEFRPGSSIQTDEQIEDYIRQYGETIYHPVGSCKMGQDEMAVVDTECRVRGVDGLRVVDASVMPTLIGGNTNAATLMIAERISDQLLGLAFLQPVQTEDVTA